MSGELSRAATKLMASFDAFDFDAVLDATADDAQILDDISRRWIRGKSDIAAHMRQVAASVSTLQSEFKDVTETVLGEAGVLTCELQQTYTLEDGEHRGGAPATLVFQREGGDWKLALFHSVALSDQT